jgi:pilus assembly protein TadC
MTAKIPIIIIRQEAALSVGRNFRDYAASISKAFPGLRQQLVEGGIDVQDLDYISAGIVSVLLLLGILVALAGVISLIALQKGLLSHNLILILFVMVVVVPLVYFLYFINYPTMQANKRKGRIDENLVFAIREVMIKIGSGVPLFNALLDISNGGYGLVSEEFKITIEEIESGIPQEIALRNLSRRIPSPSFRRAVDIIINGVKAGSDLTATLELINDMLIKQQQSLMTAYIGELTPLSMAYMLISVVLPSLGMSVFLILGSLAHFNIVSVLYLVPVMLVIFQVFFMAFIRGRRPPIGV